MSYTSTEDSSSAFVSLVLYACRREHGRKVRRAKARDGIPAHNARKADCTASRVRAVRDIVQRARVLIQPRVEEPERRVPSCEEPVVHERDHTREDWRRRGRAPEEYVRSAIDDRDEHAVRGDVRVPAAGDVK
jgi:hypothetical protein